MRSSASTFAKMVHGEQSVQMHAALPPSGILIGKSRVARLVDKGEGKGAIMHVEKELWDEADQRLVAVSEQVLFLRGDGGFSQAAGGDEPAAAPTPVPDRSAGPRHHVAYAPGPGACFIACRETSIPCT